VPTPPPVHLLDLKVSLLLLNQDLFLLHHLVEAEGMLHPQEAKVLPAL
jgi:hypothetical protein